MTSGEVFFTLIDSGWHDGRIEWTLRQQLGDAMEAVGQLEKAAILRDYTGHVTLFGQAERWSLELVGPTAGLCTWGYCLYLAAESMP